MAWLVADPARGKEAHQVDPVHTVGAKHCILHNFYGLLIIVVAGQWFRWLSIYGLAGVISIPLSRCKWWFGRGEERYFGTTAVCNLALLCCRWAVVSMAF